jgi:hypothetical protein
MKKLIIISSSFFLLTGGLGFYSASLQTYNIGITNSAAVTPAAHRYWFKTRKELLRDD